MPEQLALQQRIGKRRQVHGHKRFLASLAVLVQAPGNHLLARAAFAHDQHRGLGIGDLCQLVVQLEHRRALAEQVFEAARTLHGLAERADLLLELPPLDCAAENDGQQFHFDRLGDKVVGPCANRRNGRLQVAEGRHHDHRHVRPVGHQPRAELQPVHARHLQVGEHDIEILAAGGLEGLAGGSKQQVAKSRSRRSVSSSSHMLRSSSTMRMRGFTGWLLAAGKR